jgi:hypothetical protein
MSEGTNLKSLAFLNADIDNKVYELPPIKHLENLTVLHVAHCTVDLPNKIPLTLLINTLTRLTYIGIPYALGNIDEITNEIVLNFSLLTYLDLEGNDDLHCRGLRNISSCKMLKCLDGSHCKELVVEAMLYVAQGCPELRNLDMSGFYISNNIF